MGAVLRGGCRQEPGCGSLRDKFFRFLAFREGEDSGRWQDSFSPTVELCWCWCWCCGGFRSGSRTGELTTRPSGLRSGPSGVIEVGDSGEELGEVSMMIGESKVELLVVGDESVDSEVAEMLSRGRKESGSGDASEGYRAVAVVVVVDDVDVEAEVPVLGAAALVDINLGFLSCSAVESKPDLLYASCRFEWTVSGIKKGAEVEGGGVFSEE